MNKHNDVMYRLLVQSVVDYAIYMLQPDGTVANWNAGAERAKGYKPEEIIGKNFACFYSAEDRLNGLPQLGLQTAAESGHYEVEGWRFRKDGSSFWAHMMLDAITAEDGTLLGFANTTRDCTEQRARQAEQRSSERKLRLLVEGVTDYAIYMLDLKGLVVYWNEGARRSKGYETEEIVGKHFSVFYSAEDRLAGLPEANLGTACRTGRCEDQGWRYRKNGSAFWTHVVIEGIRNEDGELLGYSKITRDCTEVREYEQQILRARDLAEQNGARTASLSTFLDTIITNIPSCVIVEDVISQKILLLNSRAEQLLGIRQNETTGKKLSDCTTQEVGNYFAQLANAAQRSEGVHKNEQELQTPVGERIINASASVIRGSDARTNYVLMIADDVTDQRAADARIRHMAHHDNLTSLPNRVLFSQRLNEALGSDSITDKHIAVLGLDLDNFKNVNDALGHQVGDDLLRAVASRLRSVLREQDTLARSGGDEFSIVLPELNHIDEAETVAQRLIDMVKPPFRVEGHSLSVGLSVGIAIADTGIMTTNELLRRADMALYEAKRNGRNRFEHFSTEMGEAAGRRRMIETDLREAMANRHLTLYYQPITDIEGLDIIGYEALMRWNHPERGLIMPMDFIPIAEETGLIHSLGAYALFEACREAAGWPEEQCVAVNLSPLQFKNSSLVSVVEAALKESGLPPHRLEVEITESVLLDNTMVNIRTLQKLKALGVRIALDDFGTGYSSLNYLRSFPFDKIKIDKSFVNDMKYSRESLAIIRAITGMSRSLDIQITAEGVESSEQYELLKSEGCTLFQGYYFGRPQPPELRLKLLTQSEHFIALPPSSEPPPAEGPPVSA